MKWKSLAALAAACCLATQGWAQVPACRSAEESLSQVSVAIVEAYNSLDFDKARELAKTMTAKMDEGVKHAKDCGCPAVNEPVGQARAILLSAFDDPQFSDAQARLADMLTPAEAARLAAENCWRKAAQQAQSAKK